MHAVISPVDNVWHWWLYNAEGHAIAHSPEGGGFADPVDAAAELATITSGSLDVLASSVVTPNSIIKIEYDTLCLFGSGEICTPEPGEELCESCKETARFYEQVLDTA